MSNQLDSSKVLTDAEDQALLNMLNRSTCRDSLMLRLLRDYGMRCGELLSLRSCDINPIDKTITIHGSKGSRDREFPLPDDLFERLMAQVRINLIKNNHGYDKVFPITYRRLCDIWAFWRPAKKGLHSLRHRAAVRLYRQTKDIQFVQRVLGHKFLITTLIYQEFVYTQDEFRKVFLADSNHGTEPGRALASDDNLLRFRNSETGHG